MKSISTCALVACVILSVLAVSLTGCRKNESATKTSTGSGTKHNDHDHKHGDDHDHDDDHGHGPVTQLGEQSAGDFTVTASCAGDVKAGGDAAFDVTVTGSAKPVAVRMWVGTQDGKGSIKAKGEAETGGWHAHVEFPNPIPADGKFWVEIEDAKGEKSVVGFNLKL